MRAEAAKRIHDLSVRVLESTATAFFGFGAESLHFASQVPAWLKCGAAFLKAKKAVAERWTEDKDDVVASLLLFLHLDLCIFTLILPVRLQRYFWLRDNSFLPRTPSFRQCRISLTCSRARGSRCSGRLPCMRRTSQLW
jgi:hypothetical protein